MNYKVARKVVQAVQTIPKKLQRSRSQLHNLPIQRLCTLLRLCTPPKAAQSAQNLGQHCVLLPVPAHPSYSSACLSCGGNTQMLMSRRWSTCWIPTVRIG